MIQNPNTCKVHQIKIQKRKLAGIKAKKKVTAMVASWLTKRVKYRLKYTRKGRLTRYR